MQKLTYRTIEKNFEYEIPKIKGSRFLTYLFPCDNKESAEDFLQQIKKEHFSATHHCSAWRVWIQVHEDLFGNVLIDPKVECELLDVVKSQRNLCYGFRDKKPFLKEVYYVAGRQG